MQSRKPGSDDRKEQQRFGEGEAGNPNPGTAGRRPLNIALLLNDVALLAADMFPKNISVEKVIPRDLWPVSGDRVQLGQVLFTFCANSRDAMPAGGKLTLRASNFDPETAPVSAAPATVRGPHVLLEVADTGSGVGPEVLEQLALRRVATAPAATHTALGLATVVSMVQGHGGILHIQAAPLRGTTFQVYLPANPAPVAESKTAE
jgi:signal transduction histidine kinase